MVAAGGFCCAGRVLVVAVPGNRKRATSRNAVPSRTLARMLYKVFGNCRRAYRQGQLLSTATETGDLSSKPSALLLSPKKSQPQRTRETAEFAEKIWRSTQTKQPWRGNWETASEPTCARRNFQDPPFPPAAAHSAGPREI